MSTFTLKIADFKGYVNDQILASGPAKKGRKKFILRTEYENAKFKKSMLVIHFEVPSKKDGVIYPVLNIKEGIEKFNEL